MSKNLFKTQIGGTHYASRRIEPIDYINANNLTFCEGNVVKYVTRHDSKDGVKDICKAIHYLMFILRDKYNTSSKLVEIGDRGEEATMVEVVKEKD